MYLASVWFGKRTLSLLDGLCRPRSVRDVPIVELRAGTGADTVFGHLYAAWGLSEEARCVLLIVPYF